MDCKVCGHRHEILNDDYELEHTDAEEFIYINGNFTINCDMHITNVSLYACPKCNTVQI